MQFLIIFFILNSNNSCLKLINLIYHTLIMFPEYGSKYINQ